MKILIDTRGKHSSFEPARASDTGQMAKDSKVPDTCRKARLPKGSANCETPATTAGRFTVAGPSSFAGTAQYGCHMQTRHFEIEHTRAADETRSVPVTISSTFPVDRGGYSEVLLHGANNIDLSRAPLSVIESHDSGRVNIGLIEALKTDGTRLRGVMRLGASARAGELWNDILLGIVRNLSVGYMIEEVDQTSKKDNTVYVTRWTPYETSIVAVGADPQAGINRSHTFNLEHQKMSTTEIDLAMQGRAAKNASEMQIRELTRRNDLRELGDSFKEWDGVEMARRMIENGEDTDAMKRAVLEKMKTVRAVPLIGTADSNYGDFAQPSWGQGARQTLTKSKVFKNERDAFATGQFLRAMYGDEQSSRWCRENGIQQRAMSGSDNSLGGALVPDQMSSQIIDLSNTFGVFAQHADVWQMQSDQLMAPRMAGDPVATFVGQSGTITEDDPAFNQVLLSAKKSAVLTRIPTELIEDGIATADRVVTMIARGLAKLQDQCGFVGTGTSVFGGMRGIFTQIIDGTHSAGAVDVATATHNLFTEIDVTDLSTLVATLPEYAHDGAAWYCSSVAWGSVFARLMTSTSGNTASDMAGVFPKAFMGYPVIVSSVLPSGIATDYNNLAMLAFGNLKLSSKFGSRRDIRIKLLTETYAATDEIGVQATNRFDIVNHDLGSTTEAGPMVCLIGSSA